MVVLRKRLSRAHGEHGHEVLDVGSGHGWELGEVCDLGVVVVCSEDDAFAGVDEVGTVGEGGSGVLCGLEAVGGDHTEG